MAGIIKNLGIHGWNYEPACDRWWVEDVCSGKRTYARMIDGKLVQFPTAADIDWSNGIEGDGRDSLMVKPVAVPLPDGLKIGHIDGVSMHTSDAINIDEDEERDVALHGRSYQARLRDQFAMHFLSGLVAKHGSFSLDAPNAALKSYEFADAMMIAREMRRER